MLHRCIYGTYYSRQVISPLKNIISYQKHDLTVCVAHSIGISIDNININFLFAFYAAIRGEDMLNQPNSVRRRWTRDELILALELYMQLPFGKMHHSNPDVIRLATLINRTSGSIAMRLGNFAACDPHLKARGINGLHNGIDVCRPVWDEFYEHTDDLIYEAEIIVNKLHPDPIIK